MRDVSRPEAAILFGEKFIDIDGELAKYVALCKLDLLDPDVVERVLKGDRTVCCKLGAESFEKMRRLLIMHYIVRSQAVHALGELHTRCLIREVLAHLRNRVAPGQHRPHAHPRPHPHRRVPGYASRWSTTSTKPAPQLASVT